MTIVGPFSNIVIATLLARALFLVPNPVDGPFGAFKNADVLTGISTRASSATCF